MTPTLIGLGGKLRAGKDAVADRLVEAHGFVKLGMSDPLLRAALTLDPWIPTNAQPIAGGLGEYGQFVRLSWMVEHVGYVEAKRNPEVRRFLQLLGTDVGREQIDEQVWVKAAERVVAEQLDSLANVVITGIRFANEIDMIRRLGGIAVYVERPGLPDAPTGAHKSEQGVSSSDFDLVVYNDGTLEALSTKSDALVLSP